LTDIVWKHDAIQNLVLESEKKKILLAVLGHHNNEFDFDDFIPGKGGIA
jgi:hypothetical protein